MTNQEFRIWLSGFFELVGQGAQDEGANNGEGADQEDILLSRQQLFIIGNHANLAEAVEGALESDVETIRTIVRQQVQSLPEPSSLADASVAAEICALLE